MPSNKFNLSIMTINKPQNFSIISSNFMQMVMTKSPIILPAGFQDCHELYEFLIPISRIPRLTIGNREIDCHPGQLIPIAPGVTHGVKRTLHGISYILIFFEPADIDRIIRQISGMTFKGVFPLTAYQLKPDIQHMISRMIFENRSSEGGREVMLKCMSEELALLLIRHYFQRPVQAELIAVDEMTGEQERFRDVIAFIQNNFHFRLTVDRLAELTGMQSFHFIRSFKKAFDISPYCFLLRVRVCNAKQMLIHTALPASDIGQMCGFQSASRFSAVFLQETGKTPSIFRKENT